MPGRSWRRKPKRDEAGLREAKAILAQARADEIPVAEAVEATKQRLRENHLAPKIRAAMGVEYR